MKNILVAINLRSDFENILRYAESVAARSNAHITLFYAGGRRLLKGTGEFQYNYLEEPSSFFYKISHAETRGKVEKICKRLSDLGTPFDFKLVSSYSINEVVRETEEASYDLVLMGTHSGSGLRGYWDEALASKVIGEVKVPVFLVPAHSHFNDIDHISYAVDLTDYDPNIIRQVKSIAGLFDAKLTIVHVNAEHEAGEDKEKYRLSLERTISDTLDYPKVYYKFFDHSDPFGGILKFVHQNNSHLLAMINRKKFSWGDIFSRKSMTRKMSQELSVPLLAFSKH